MKIFIVALLLLFLVGCAGSQNYGTTTVKAEWGDDGKIKSLTWNDGKEKKLVKIKASMGDFTFDYTATDVLSFEGQKVAADLHKELVKQGVKVTLSTVTKALTAYLGAPALAGVERLVLP